MTFVEWAKETAKLTNPRLNSTIVKMVLYCAIKAVLEEFEANKANAELDIQSIGRFYLNRRRTHASNFGNYTTNGTDSFCWEVHFKPSSALKKAINGKKEYKDLPLMRNKLFTDEKVSLGYSFDVKKNTKGVPNADYKNKIVSKTNYEVREKILNNGMSYEEIASVLGITKRTLLVELNKPISVKNYRRIMKAIEVIKHERQQHIWR